MLVLFCQTHFNTGANLFQRTWFTKEKFYLKFNLFFIHGKLYIYCKNKLQNLYIWDTFLLKKNKKIWSIYIRKGILKHFGKFAGKYLCQSLFLNKKRLNILNSYTKYNNLKWNIQHCYKTFTFYQILQSNKKTCSKKSSRLIPIP